MFSHKATVKMTLAQYFALLVLHIIYAYYKYGEGTGNKIVLCSIICFGGALLVCLFVKNETVTIYFIFLAILLSIWYVGAVMNGTMYYFIVLMAAGLLVATYVNYKRNIMFMIASDVILIVSGIQYYFKDDSGHSIALFGLLFMAYNISNVTICYLVYVLEKRMENLEDKTREALSASESKGAFLANMSHEIRTPLNAITGLNQLVLQEDISDDVREKALGIQTASSDLMTIINDILDFSKIESGKMQIIEAEYNTKDMINDIVNLVFLRTEEHKIEFLVDCDPALPKRLYGDEVRIKQVAMNLLSNAIKFTNKGYIKLKIAFEETGDDIQLIIEVEDSGIGIKQNSLNRLFDSFEQLDTRKNRKVEGTGLGLAISKQLVVLMNGDISVKSEYGKGSVFAIAIPQKVVSKESLVNIQNKDVQLMLYTPSDKYRQIYERMFSMIQISCVFTTSFQTVGEYVAKNRLTHYIVADECYDRHREFFVELSKQVQVIICQDRTSNISVKDGLKTVYRPFYLLPLEAVLNGEQTYGIFSKEAIWDFEYIAPKAKILVVDDNEVNLRVTVGLMKPVQMQITTANSGLKAVELMKQERFDMIFMDHMMPEVDGVEATKMIRELSQEKWDYYDTVPIVALTANAIGGAKDMFLQNGFQDFMAKPMELRDLDRVLRKWLPTDYMQVKMLQPQPFIAKTAKEQWQGKESFDKNSQFLQEDNSKKDWPQAIIGLDLSVAKHYFAGDYELFQEITSSFYSSSMQKIDVLKMAFINKDWPTYDLESHALKSSAKSIGAIDFSAAALEMEMAAKKQDVDIIRQKHLPFISMLTELLEQLRPYVKVEENENQLPLMRLKEVKTRLEMMDNLWEVLKRKDFFKAKFMPEYKDFSECVYECQNHRYSRESLKQGMASLKEALDQEDGSKVEKCLKKMLSEI